MTGIGVIITDGKAQGIKPLIKSIAKEGLKKGYKIVMFLDGFQSLLDWKPIVVHLSDFEATIDRALFGGCGLEVQDGHQNIWQKVGHQLSSNGLQSMVVIGGVDGLECALKFHNFIKTKDNKIGFNVVCIPVTIEWFGGTDTTIGVDSALNSIVHSMEMLTSNDSKKQEVIIIELNGQDIGHLALKVAIAMEATNAYIEEHLMSSEWSQQLISLLEAEKINKKLLSFLVVSNGCWDRNGLSIDARRISYNIKKHSNIVDIKAIGHELYGQLTSAYDLILANLMGVEVIGILVKNEVKTPTVMTIKNFKVIPKPLKECLDLNNQRIHWLRGLKDTDNQTPPDSMGSHYNTLWKAFNVMKSEIPNGSQKGYSFAITQTGQQFNGINASVFGFTKQCLLKSVKPITVSLNFRALTGIHTICEDLTLSSVYELTKAGKTQLKSSEIPDRLRDRHFKGMNTLLKDNQIKGLVICGGSKALDMIRDMRKQNKKYPDIKIPIALIGSSIAEPIHNIPYTLGTDSNLNETLNQYRNVVNTSSEKNIVFILQTNGNTKLTGVLISADFVYDYNETQTMSALKAQVIKEAKSLRINMSSIGGNRVIVLNSKVNTKLRGTTVEELYRQEGMFDTTGHIGYKIFKTQVIDCTKLSRPSALDRIQAFVVGVRAVSWLRDSHTMHTSGLAIISFADSEEI